MKRQLKNGVINLADNIPFVVITSVQRDNLLAYEEDQGTYSTVLPAGEDDATPTDFCYIRSDGSGDYEIDESAYIHAARCGFDWERASDPGYKDQW